MTNTLIHFQESYQEELEDMDQFLTFGDGELDVILDNKEELSVEELCITYVLNPSQVLYHNPF